VLEARQINNPTRNERSECRVGYSGHPRGKRARGTQLLISQKIPPIIINSILYKERTILLCKSDLFMVLFLFHNISDRRIFFADTFANTSIFPSPTLKSWEVWVCDFCCVLTARWLLRVSVSPTRHSLRSFRVGLLKYRAFSTRPLEGTSSFKMSFSSIKFLFSIFKHLSNKHLTIHTDYFTSTLCHRQRYTIFEYIYQ